MEDVSPRPIPFDFLVDFAQGDYEALIAGADDEAVFLFYRKRRLPPGLLKSVARGMLPRKRGRLIYVSSAAAERPAPGQGFYAAAKLASEALYRNSGLNREGGTGNNDRNPPARVLRRRPGARPFWRRTGEYLRQVPIGRALAADGGRGGRSVPPFRRGSGHQAEGLTMDGGLASGKRESVI